MERLWIANIAPGTSDDEMKALVASTRTTSSAPRSSTWKATAAARPR